GWVKVAGIGKILNRLGGHTIMNARPMTLSAGIVPPRSYGTHVAGEYVYAQSCSRESADSGLLSPMTHSRPGGTTMLNLPCDGLAPGNRYDVSCRATPLTVTSPRALQQAT